MSDVKQWQMNNDRYLALALAWLRLRLARVAGNVPPRQPAWGLKDERQSGWFSRHKQSVEESVPSVEKVTDEMISEAAQAMAGAAQVDPPPALLILGHRLGLSYFEQEILLLCASMELDTRIPALCALAQDHQDRPYPTFALAFMLFDNPGWDALSADRPLRYWRLIEINQPGATPLTLSALRADERIVNYLKGLNQLDDRLAPLFVPFELPHGGETGIATTHVVIADAIERCLRVSTDGNRLPLIQLTGMDSISKQEVALEVLRRMGWQGFRLPADLLPSAPGEIEALARLCHRESLLLPLALYLDAADADEVNRPPESALQLNRFVARCGTLAFLDTREVRTGMGANAPAFEIDKPTPTEQLTAWKEALGEDAGERPEQLACQFNLNLPTIRHVSRCVLSEKQMDERVSNLLGCLWKSCLSQTRPRLDRLAQRIEPKATWQDLVLPEAPLELLHEIAAQVRHRSKVYDQWGFRRKMSRGFGISALFGGESGTGKTMAAEVIANELCLDLYHIDLSAVVSKYIGETEKNLRRVFDAAEDGGVILFFDEADALFGKRSEVKDSHDRYANIEINYLLQRMEAYRGLAILATNMKSALDQAFLRRLRFVVKFPFPGAPERKRIWEQVFPKDDPNQNLSGTPLGKLDYDHLAQINLTGGSIHNIALNAAFLAASKGTPVTMPLIFEAGRAEFRKLEKPVNEGEFRCLKPIGAKA